MSARTTSRNQDIKLIQSHFIVFRKTFCLSTKPTTNKIMVSRYHSGINGERQTFNMDDDRHDYADEFTHIFQVLLNRMIGFLEILWPGVMGAAKR